MNPKNNLDPKKAIDYKILSPKFTRSEFLCKHCREEGIQPELVEAMQRIRDVIMTPIIITSAYRCKNHPVEAGKQDPGHHAYGIACDFYAPGLRLVDLLEKVVDLKLFRGLGINKYSNYIHGDLRKSKPAHWCYNRRNVVLPWIEGYLNDSKEKKILDKLVTMW